MIRIKQIIIHSNLAKMKNKIVPTCLQRNYRYSLGEFSNTSYGVFGATGLKTRVQDKIVHNIIISEKLNKESCQYIIL